MGGVERRFLVVPGVMKSGTTTLYSLLTQHPDIHAIDRPGGGKGEVQFFSLEENVVYDYFSWYQSKAGHEDKVCLDYSTSYFMAPKAPGFISHLVGPVKYLIILRDPVKRAFSNYTHMRRQINEFRDFGNIVNFVWDNRDEGVKEAENEYIYRAINEGGINPGHVHDVHLEGLPVPSTSNYQDPLWQYKYFQQSMFSQRLTSFWESDGEVKVICLEELISDTHGVVDDIFRYIEVEPYPVKLSHKHKGSVPTSRRIWWKQAGRFLRGFNVTERLLETSWVTSLRELARPREMSTRRAREKVGEEVFRRARKLLEEEYKFWVDCRPDFAKRWEE